MASLQPSNHGSVFRSGSAQELARLAAIIESSEDAILSKDLRGIVLTWNPAAERLFGYSEAEIAGRNVVALIPRARLAEERMIIDRIRRGEKVDHYETVRQAKDGRLIDVSISVSPIRNVAGKVVGASSIFRDISERRRIEHALVDRERRLNAIVAAAVDAIISIDERGTIESVNPATEKLFGYDSSELLGRNIKMLMPEPFQGEHDGYLRNYIRTGIPKIIGIGREVTGLRKDGSTFPMSLSVSEIRLDERRLFTGIIHDLSGRRVLERQVLDASTDEQRRIGQDLHDGLCQDLIGMAFQADFAAKNLAAREAPEAEAISKLAMTIRDAAAQARQLSHGLNPVNLEAGGLPAALQTMAEKVSTAHQVSCTFHWGGNAQVHDDMIATHLYRIAQEAIGNAIRHGKAGRIQVRFSATRGERLTLVVKDNGIGLPQSLLQKANTVPTTGITTPKPSGIGLQTMRYRANMIGANLWFSPARGNGTIMTCSMRSKAQPKRPSPPASRRAVRVRKSS